jgi:hypothetical protein
MDKVKNFFSAEELALLTPGGVIAVEMVAATNEVAAAKYVMGTLINEQKELIKKQQLAKWDVIEKFLQLGPPFDTKPPESNGQVIVEIVELEELLPELQSITDQQKVVTVVEQAWEALKTSTLQAPPYRDALETSNTRDINGTIPNFVDNIVTSILMTEQDIVGQHSMNSYYETKLGDGIIDWMFNHSFEAMLNIHGDNLEFALEAKRIQGGKVNERSYLSEGIKQCIQRLGTKLRSRTNRSSSVIGAATNGCTIVFVRVDIQPDSYQQPLRVSRSHPFRLTISPSALKLKPKIPKQNDAVPSVKGSSQDDFSGGSEIDSSVDNGISGNSEKSYSICSAASPQGSSRVDGSSCGSSGSSRGRSGSSRGSSVSTAGENFSILNVTTSSKFLEAMNLANDKVPIGFSVLCLILQNCSCVCGGRKDLPSWMIDSNEAIEGVAINNAQFLAKGGFADVFSLAANDGQTYCLKIVRRENDATLLDAEATILQTLHSCEYIPQLKQIIQNDHIPKVLVLFPTGQCIIDCMPFIRIPNVSVNITAALKHAHGHNICHCDVRPSNIIFYQGKFMLIDWGLSTAPGTKRRGEFGHIGYLADSVVTNIIENKDYSVSTKHDYAGLYFSLLYILAKQLSVKSWLYLRGNPKALVAKRSDAIKEVQKLVDDQSLCCLIDVLAKATDSITKDKQKTKIDLEQLRI